jgi:hypothetical protein
MKTIQDASILVNDSFSNVLPKEFEKRFDIKVKTFFNILLMTYQTDREDDLDFTLEQQQWVNAFESGYYEALKLIWSLE